MPDKLSRKTTWDPLHAEAMALLKLKTELENALAGASSLPCTFSLIRHICECPTSLLSCLHGALSLFEVEQEIHKSQNASHQLRDQPAHKHTHTHLQSRASSASSPRTGTDAKWAQWRFMRRESTSLPRVRGVQEKTAHQGNFDSRGSGEGGSMWSDLKPYLCNLVTGRELTTAIQGHDCHFLHSLKYSSSLPQGLARVSIVCTFHIKLSL